MSVSRNPHIATVPESLERAPIEVRAPHVGAEHHRGSGSTGFGAVHIVIIGQVELLQIAQLFHLFPPPAPPPCVSLALLRETVKMMRSQSDVFLRPSVSQSFHGPAPRSPLHRLAVRLRHSRSNTSTEYSLPGCS